MTRFKDFDCRRLPELYRVDSARLALARRRQHAVWSGEIPDAWPILFSGVLDEDQEAIPFADHIEAFRNPAAMLCQQMRPACAAANADADVVPSIRANTGTGTLLSCFGLEQIVQPGQMPWLKEHLSLAQAAKLTPDDIVFQGTFAHALEQIAFFREIMGDAIDIYCLDTQGPFDLAHMLVGDQLFYVLLDDPSLTHHIMELASALYIRCTEAVKAATGEPATSMVHGNGLSLANGGVRICEDTTTIVGRATMEQFVLPYTRRVAAHFGGAWVHFCGRCDDLADLLCQCPEVCGLNYGIIPGKEEDFDFDREVERWQAAGKVYHGALPRRSGESGKDYLRRLHDYASRGCFIPNGGLALAGEDGLPSSAAALDFWYSLL